MVKRLVIVILIFLMIILSGCWDKIEIEKRAFILGIAIDKADSRDEVMVTFQIALPKAFGAETGGEMEAYWNITKTAKNIGIARDMLFESINWVPTFEHCPLLLIGEDLAKEGLKEYMDFFLRTYDIRRRMVVAVVQGKARDLLDIKTKSEPVPAFFISEIMNQNSDHKYGISGSSYLGRIHEKLVRNADFMLSRVILDGKDKVRVAGGGLFKDFKLVGWLDSNELMAARMLRGDISGGYLTSDLPKELGSRIILRIFDASSSLTPKLQDDKLIVISRIRLEGDIIELDEPGVGINDINMLRAIQDYMEKDLEDKIKKVFIKTQQQYDCNPFLLDERVMNSLPNYWDKINKNWHEIYKTIELKVDADILIRRVGEVNY